MDFENLGLELKITENDVEVMPGVILKVKSYLPIEEKVKFIEFVASRALDSTTGTFSPVRVELYFTLALCRWYAGINFNDEVNSADIYDLLETNSIISQITAAIPKDEFEFLSTLTEETINDMSRYNSSAAGVIEAMLANAEALEKQINTIFSDVEKAKGVEVLSEIRDVVGKDKPTIVVKKG